MTSGRLCESKGALFFFWKNKGVDVGPGRCVSYVVVLICKCIDVQMWKRTRWMCIDVVFNLQSIRITFGSKLHKTLSFSQQVCFHYPELHQCCMMVGFHNVHRYPLIFFVLGLGEQNIVVCGDVAKNEFWRSRQQVRPMPMPMPMAMAMPTAISMRDVT